MYTQILNQFQLNSKFTFLLTNKDFLKLETFDYLFVFKYTKHQVYSISDNKSYIDTLTNSEVKRQIANAFGKENYEDVSPASVCDKAFEWKLVEKKSKWVSKQTLRNMLECIYKKGALSLNRDSQLVVNFVV